MFKFKEGDTAYGVGLDMNCDYVVTKFTIVKIFDEPDEHGYDCVIQTSDKIKILSNLNECCATRYEAEIVVDAHIEQRRQQCLKGTYHEF